MKNIFLHIGEHKTGTTAIQTSLQDLYNREILQKKDFAFIYNEIYTLLNASWIKTNEKHTIERVINKIQSFIEQSPEKNIIISCEGFVALDFLKNNNIEPIYNILHKHNTKVLIYLRRQDKAIESGFAQLSKELAVKLQLPKEARPKKEFLDGYAKLFGKENILVRVYEKNNLYHNNAIHDFLQWINLEKLIPELQKTFNNPSLSPLNMRIRLSLMRQNIMDDKVRAQRLKEIQTKAKKVTGSMPWDLTADLRRAQLGFNFTTDFCHVVNMLLALEKSPAKNTHAYFSHEERKAILDECREENAAIAREYLGREDGVLFDESMPEELVSLDSPTTDDLVASFLPIFVHLTQRIEKLEKQYNDLVQEMHTQNIQQKEGNNTTTKQNNPQAEKTHQVQKDNNSLLTQNSPPMKPSHLQCFKNTLLQPFLKKKAFVLCREKKFQEAEVIAQSFITNNPNIAWAYYILAKVQCHQNKRMVALGTVKKACSLENHPRYEKLLQKIQIKLNK